jgi:hypothetical protein
MRSIALSVLVLSITLVISSARAETPTTQPQITIEAKGLGLQIAPAAPGDGEIPAPISAFKSSDLDLRYRALPTPPPVNKLPRYGAYRTLVPATQNNLQNWSSFNYNGVTVWNRPAIYDKTIHAVQDRTTGKVFYYRDFANTVPIEAERIGTIIRKHSPANDLNLLDDRPKQK